MKADVDSVTSQSDHEFLFVSSVTKQTIFAHLAQIDKVQTLGERFPHEPMKMRNSTVWRPTLLLLSRHRNASSSNKL